MSFDSFIFDFDGTLYYQFPVRLFMALNLLMHYILRPLRFRELFALMTYRRLREKRFYAELDDFRTLQIVETARLHKIKPERVIELINLWMNKKPLMIIRIFRRRKLLEFMKELQVKGKIIIIYSDYPVKEKLEAINFIPNHYYCSDDELIHCMKPDASGLIRMLNSEGLNIESCLYVGDRYDRDGLCAESAGIVYMDVKEFVRNFLKEA